MGESKCDLARTKTALAKKYERLCTTARSVKKKSHYSYKIQKYRRQAADLCKDVE